MNESFIPYGRQWIDQDDRLAVANVLDSDFLTCGPEVEKFEEEFAALCGARHAVAVANGTAALHLAMMAAGIGPGDRVLTSPITFLASANSAAFVGATPDFVDIDPESRCLDADLLESAWSDDVRAVVPVAYAGQSPDMPAIAAMARNSDAVIIEDVCHGPGGGILHNGECHRLGGHEWADMSAFSFHPVKSMTTGEGGMVTTDHDDYAERLRILRQHGMERDPGRFREFSGDAVLGGTGPWLYEMHSLGYNYRITDLQCALGRSQLRKLASFTARRREIVGKYNREFEECPFLTVPKLSDPNDPETVSWHLYAPEFDFDLLGRSRAEVMRALREVGVGTQVHYIPVHLQPWYRERFGYGPGKCPRAETYYEKTLSLPLYPRMSAADVERVIAAVRGLGD